MFRLFGAHGAHMGRAMNTITLLSSTYGCNCVLSKFHCPVPLAAQELSSRSNQGRIPLV